MTAVTVEKLQRTSSQGTILPFILDGKTYGSTRPPLGFLKIAWLGLVVVVLCFGLVLCLVLLEMIMKWCCRVQCMSHEWKVNLLFSTEFDLETEYSSDDGREGESDSTNSDYESDLDGDYDHRSTISVRALE